MKAANDNRFLNWAGLLAEMVMLASAFIVVFAAVYLAAQLGFHSTQGEWLP